jgi:hypothetical protein
MINREKGIAFTLGLTVNKLYQQGSANLVRQDQSPGLDMRVDFKDVTMNTSIS